MAGGAVVIQKIFSMCSSPAVSFLCVAAYEVAYIISISFIHDGRMMEKGEIHCCKWNGDNCPSIEMRDGRNCARTSRWDGTNLPGNRTGKQPGREQAAGW